MIKFLIHLIDECGSEFCEELEADSSFEAFEAAQEKWPESSIRDIESPEQVAERQLNVYADAMDDDYDYSEDY